MSYDHRGVRNSMAYVIDNFWPGILGKIVGLRDSLFPMLGADAREKLGDSFDTLQSIYVSIIDEDYVLGTWPSMKACGTDRTPLEHSSRRFILQSRC